MREHLLAVLDLDDVVDDAADGVAHRRQRPANVEQVVPKLRNASTRRLGRARLDPVLELVDLLVEVVDQIEVSLGNVVDKAVRHHAG